MDFSGADTDKGRALLSEWFDQEDIEILGDSALVDTMLTIQKHTGARFTPSQLRSTAAALVVHVAERFEKIGE